MFLRLLALELVRLGTCPPGYEKKCPLQKQATTQVLREQPEKIVNRVFQILPKSKIFRLPHRSQTKAFQQLSRTFRAPFVAILRKFFPHTYWSQHTTLRGRECPFSSDCFCWLEQKN
ncbi:uncharacterized protein LOC113472308, partial [Diaphorina citri]|uniref:Uncharacterized protein LOC113472308 n=1 Tax=Diaphorina citri TaxID=121845 RepID=A0A3Q0JLS1_DIACI